MPKLRLFIFNLMLILATALCHYLSCLCYTHLQLYWFTVEFGLVNEGGIPKAYGAGLLSGNEELQYCGTERPERNVFEIEECLVTRYPETGLQPLYFVADSLEDMRIKMR